MKKFFYMAVAAIAALSSCNSDNDAILGEDGKQNEGVTTFTATFEGGVTRATLEGTTPKWEENDAISVDGHEYSASAAGANVSFTGTGATETTHHAYFPKALYNGGTPTLPGVQTYTAGKFNMPMYATSTDANLSFKNLCGVLAICVTSGTVKTITVISDLTPLSGAFDISNDAAVLKVPYSNQVILNCGEDVTANNTTFFVAVPAMNNANLQITVSDGDPDNDKVAKKTGVTIARNTLYAINFPASPTTKDEKAKYHAWVQFEATGVNAVKWATRNIGASTETSDGPLYRWGAVDVSENASTSNDDIAGTAQDVAYATWGTVGPGSSMKTWQMPTMAMFDNLVSNTYYWEKVGDFSADSSSGYNVYLKKTATGATYNASVDAHVFFPAAGYTGYEKGSKGCYWSSTPYGFINAYSLVFDSSSQNVYSNKYRSDAYSVRAVLR